MLPAHSCPVRFHRRLGLLAASLCLLSAAACESAALTLIGAYPGPNPDRTDIVAETVIVRTAREQAETGIEFFLFDRVRVLKTKPHDINRIVEVMSRDIQAEVSRLDLQVGDTILISTRYVADREAGELGEYVPDWPFDKYGEYPIGFHTLTAVERVSR
ncbi:MAG TPA: hypothetical protein VF613_02730 [Longimicrobium sp.]